MPEEVDAPLPGSTVNHEDGLVMRRLALRPPPRSSLAYFPLDPTASGRHLVLMSLDVERPLDPVSHLALQQYVKAFFQMELVEVVIPETLTSGAGLKALAERTALPMKTRPSRRDMRHMSDRQIFVPELFSCLQKFRREHPKSCNALDEAVCVLCVTKSELFTDDEGYPPGMSMPIEETVPMAVSSSTKQIGVFSLAHINYTMSMGRPERSFLRRLFNVVTHEVVKMLGLKGCKSNQCIAYSKPFVLEETPFWLCDSCDYHLILSLSSAPHSELVNLAAKRYKDLADCLHRLSRRLEKVRIGFRYFTEFEKDIDWLRLAEEHVTKGSQDKHTFIDMRGNLTTKLRSLQQLIWDAHHKQGHRTIHRILSEPSIRKTCLVDMAASGPFRHESGDVGTWTKLIVNRRHTSGGKYVELGGSTFYSGNPKKIGCFADAGLNASMIKRAATEEEDLLSRKTRSRRSTQY